MSWEDQYLGDYDETGKPIGVGGVNYNYNLSYGVRFRSALMDIFFLVGILPDIIIFLFRHIFSRSFKSTEK
jgi:hypothetical protein